MQNPRHMGNLKSEIWISQNLYYIKIQYYSLNILIAIQVTHPILQFFSITIQIIPQKISHM